MSLRTSRHFWLLTASQYDTMLSNNLMQQVTRVGAGGLVDCYSLHLTVLCKPCVNHALFQEMAKKTLMRLKVQSLTFDPLWHETMMMVIQSRLCIFNSFSSEWGILCVYLWCVSEWELIMSTLSLNIDHVYKPQSINDMAAFCTWMTTNGFLTSHKLVFYSSIYYETTSNPPPAVLVDCCSLTLTLSISKAS